MRRGKEIAQGSHASMEFLASQIRQRLNENANISIDLNTDETAWLSKGMAKVCLQVNSEQDLLDYRFALAGVRQTVGRVDVVHVPRQPAPVA